MTTRMLRCRAMINEGGCVVLVGSVCLLMGLISGLARHGPSACFFWLACFEIKTRVL
jgi:hypothetical protein